MSFRGPRRLSGCAVFALLCAGSACKLFESTCDEDDRTCLGGGLARSGEPCIRSGDCATGMECRDERCTYAATTRPGGECVVTAECASGHYCSHQLRCEPIAPNAGAAGAACNASDECAKGLVCDLDLATAMREGPFAKLSETCRETSALLEREGECSLPTTCAERGRKDFGTACRDNSECLAGLYCALSPLAETEQTTCLGGVELSVEPISFPSWAGVDCPDDAASPTAYFEVPRAEGSEADFYRLPFPNDIRRRDGAVDLEAHPHPGPSVDPPVAGRILEDVASSAGFSTNPTVYFRFSTAYEGGRSLSLAVVKLIDISPESPEYNLGPSIAWGPSERDSRYICPHWLSIHRPISAPLRPNTTYTAIVTRELRTRDGREFQRSPDFEAMLEAVRPSDSALAAAWEAYAPLRAWLADPETELEPDDLLNAAVFTTGHPQAAVERLAAAVDAADVPRVSELTVCTAGAKSPCEDGDGRGACHPERLELVEMHGKLSLPVFQRGDAPYASPDDGGDLDLDDQGRPRIVRREDVCFALAIPRQPAPAGGYPVLLYAHATGGVFQEALAADGLASDLADASPPAALLAIELPQHGFRRGGSTRPPEDLFFNLRNPAALRGNVLQGAADLLGLIRLATSGIPAAATPGGQPIRFDASRIAMFAHGQGATHAALALAEDDTVRAVVLAGIAGHAAMTWANRTRPVSSAALLPLLFADVETDGRLPGSAVHPMLALLQHTQDSADPINYADRLTRIGPNLGRDVFLVYGLDDHFTPESTQEAFAKAAKLAAVEPDLSLRFRTLDPPVRENLSVGDDDATAALRTYDPAVEPVDPSTVPDGHYVARGSRPAREDIVRFLTQALAGAPPSIGAP